MKLIAYLCTDYVYFSRLLPELRTTAEVLPVVVCELLHKLGGNATPAGLAGIWDYLMGRESYDALWCYGLPDEITLAQCRRHRIPVLIQEYWGHYPGNLTGILPHHADWQAYYAAELTGVRPEPGRKNDHPAITVCLSDGLYSAESTLGAVMKDYVPGGKSPRNPFWYPNRLFHSYAELAALVIDICRRDTTLVDCPVRVRLHPRYPERFQAAADDVVARNDPRYTVDISPVGDSLAATDIVVHVNSNYGFDGLRAGAEVISVGGRAFFDHPQLTAVVETASQLRVQLRDKAALIRQRGRQRRQFLPLLLRDLTTRFHHPCLEPYPAGVLGEVLQRAAAVPQLP
ncbi:MAG: hypothetical protein PHQ27_02560 [Victivallales bacterium]|nr:hypothetical protein [Victivallales bacterium]